MERDIISESFYRWTKGLSPKEARVALFKKIRDIPYAIVPALRDPARGPAGMLQSNSGSCQPKHYLLGRFFKNLDIPIKYATFIFKWQDGKIAWPDDIKEMLPRLSEGYHLALMAFIEGRWVDVDATYDLPLEKAGFPVTRDWDGVSDTVVAVKDTQRVIHESLDERIAYVAEKAATMSGRGDSNKDRFIEKLNAWLMTLRNPV